MHGSPQQISDRVWVMGQVDPRDMRELFDAGFTLMVNHRPNAEESGQPTSDEIDRRAVEAGVRAVHAPVRGLPDAAAVAATRAALEGMGPDDKVLMFCRSGMRSACAWALVERANGAEPEALREAALKAGYDLSRVPL